MEADARSCLPPGPVPSLSIPLEDATLSLVLLSSEDTKGALLSRTLTQGQHGPLWETIHGATCGKKGPR